MEKKDIVDILEYSKNLKLLYAEDNTKTRNQTSMMLKKFFSNFDVATDGEQALEMFNTNHYDLILSDINMPKMSGIEMFEKIRETNEDIPLIILTAQSDSESFINSIEINIDSYVLKPLEIDQFISVIKKTIKKIKAFDDSKKYREGLENLNVELEKKVDEKTKQLKEKLYFDELTKVNSRYSLIETISKLKKDECGILLSLKIDSFGMYNDLYSNEVGNKVLIEFGKVLENFANENSFKVFRSHGDNFLLFSSNRTCTEDILLKNIKNLENFLIDKYIFIEDIDDNIILTTTIGAAYGNNNLLANANMALTKARKGLYTHYIYDPKDDTKEYIKDVLYWKSEIQKAKSEDRVIPYFQAIYDRNLNIVKYESLVRISQILAENKINIVTPNKFLDIAKATKQYIKLSYITIEKTLDIAIEKGISVSINLSFLDIQNHNLIKLLEDKIAIFMEKRESTSKNIILEILEDESIKDYDYVKTVLHHLKEVGALVAIDDFGSGYSNLKHILELSPDFIKIDGSLIKEINEDTKSKEIVKAIILFAKTTGIKTIAEFVYDKKVFDTVFNLGIDEFQGYYLSKPTPSIEIE